MNTYKFTTKITKDGTVQIPKNAVFFDKEVEITIVEKIPQKTKKSNAVNFAKKWAGFLQETGTDNARYNYLMDKHQ